MTSKLSLPRLAHTFRTAVSTHSYDAALHSPSRPWPSVGMRIGDPGSDLNLSLSSNSSFPAARCFGTTNSPPLLKASGKHLPPRPKPPPEEEIDESFLKGSGPGGQKINKTNSAVQLKHIPTGLVVKCQATRSRSQNRTIARQLLADKLDDMTRGDQSRSSVVGEVKRKKKASSAKKSRRKYRKLDEEREATVAETLEEEETSDDVLGRGLTEERDGKNENEGTIDDKATLSKRQAGI